MKKRIFDVVGALIEDNDKILLCKRMHKDQFGSMWEFPGGKVEDNEDKVEALKRELKEEIGIEIDVSDLVDIFEDEIPTMKIHVYLYNCSIIKGTPRCIECQDIKWVTLDEITKLNLAPADKKIAQYLERRA